jgi:hypothetical protein
MKFLSLLLCFCFLIKDVQASPPRIVQVSPEEMAKIKKEHPEAETKEVVLSDKDEPANRVLETTSDVFSGFSPNSGEEVLIVFAIVGVVLVIAWIASFPVAVYKAVKDKDTKRQHLLGLNYFKYSLDEFDGNLYGLKYGFYLGDNVGITSEVGQYELRNHGYTNGQYWLVGPSMIYKMDDFLFKLDLGAGSSFDSQFGLMSKADFSFNWLSKSGFNIGFGLGGMYLQLREFDGVSRSNQEVGIGWALNTGYLF